MVSLRIGRPVTGSVLVVVTGPVLVVGAHYDAFNDFGMIACSGWAMVLTTERLGAGAAPAKRPSGGSCASPFRPRRYPSRGIRQAGTPG